MENSEIKTDYKIEIILEADDDSVRNGVGMLAKALYEEVFERKGERTMNIFSYSVEPIDRESDEYKFIRDMDK
tara:strand:+ start:449 stop:667 length:219 start_codon:yes stop_codon:yes gene_type:complete